ncbi:hypothetical protein IX293_001314 [Fusobacterium necrophorum]|nr:retron system putative HNH endonuclease [Fusobacterium necrophorum]MBR8823049.1 hypothetical protein [Fusobacterium necrophorum]
MILIKKKIPPHSFTEYKNQPTSSFDELPTDIKQELRLSLLKEQGYICAYCMKRISEETDVKIEHYKPKSLYPMEELNYKNLLAVCDGGIGTPLKRQTCDTQKGSQELSFNPQNESDVSTIFFSRNGKIYSSNPIFQTEFDTILNLNDQYGYLIKNRHKALITFQKKISKMNNSQIGNYYKWLKENSTEKKLEYLGIILWYLSKKFE